MNKFLELVANDIVQRYPTGMNDLTVVFAGKRARLFLNEYILEIVGHPVWAPKYLTMQELFLSMSDFTLIEPIEAICLLHKAYIENMPDTQESLDAFYGWGEVLLSDFDDIDKHMVDAHLLFSNIGDLEKLTNDNYLTKEQLETLQHVFPSFSLEENTEMRKRFCAMWNVMPAIYDQFNAEMRQVGRLTEGALYRDVIERLRKGDICLPTNQHAFVGLNPPNDTNSDGIQQNVENILLRMMRDNGNALFYWDYDQYYMNKAHEAGLFMRENLKQFEAYSPLSGEHFNNLTNTNKQFTYVATAGSSIQTRYIPRWLKSLKSNVTQKPNTAIVLCDESLLEQVLHCIPDADNDGPTTANITMGYPLSSTQIYSLVKAILSLHAEGWNERTQRFRTRELRILEYHPLIRQDIEDGTITIGKHINNNLQLVQYIQSMLEFAAGREMERAIAKNDGKPLKSEDVTPEHALISESIFRAHSMIVEITSLIADNKLNVSMRGLANIIDRAMQSISVPFHGEPAEGLQIMGLLETRCLDYDNILVISANESHMPKTDHKPSFIPYTLRKPFGLTKIEHRTCTQAYYFYRLIQRAQNVTFVYDTSCSDGNKNEMSRFLRQMLVEMRPDGIFPDEAISYKSNIEIPVHLPIEAQNSDAVKQKLRNISSFSPSALEQYVSCPMQYYLHYIAGIKEYREDEERMDAAMFGEIFHNSSQAIYERTLDENGKSKGPLTPDFLLHFLNGKPGEAELQNIVNQQFDKVYFSKPIHRNETLTGDLLIRRDVIVRYLQSLLRHDLKTLEHCQRTVIQCEKPTTLPLTLSDGTTIKIGGFIDRLDKIVTSDGVARYQIIDYKTMSRGKESIPRSLCMDDIFTQDEKYKKHMFQTFIYSLTLCDKENARLNGLPSEDCPVQPTLFYTQDSTISGYTTTLSIEGNPIYDFRPYANIFTERLRTLIDRIFTEPFTQTTNRKHCAYCPFCNICQIN